MQRILGALGIKTQHPFWISWYGRREYGPFTLHSPWWITGYSLDDDTPTFCAAVRATSETDAKQVIIDAHDSPPANIEWRFVRLREQSWTPFAERFPRADWMQW